jgi:hypothetical protein
MEQKNGSITDITDLFEAGVLLTKEEIIHFDYPVLEAIGFITVHHMNGMCYAYVIEDIENKMYKPLFIYSAIP